MTYVSYGLNVVLTLISTPLMINKLDQTEYGVYQLMIPLVSCLQVLTFGLGSAYTRYYSIYKTQGNKEKMANLNGMFITIYSALGLLAGVIGFGMSFFMRDIFPELSVESVPLAKTLLRIMSINMACSFPVYVFTSHIVVNEAYVFQKTVAALKMILNPIITIPLLFLGFGTKAITLLALTLTVATGVVDMIYCFKVLKMPVKFGHFDTVLMKDMGRFTFFVFISIVVDEINWNSDRIVLGMFRGENDVAVYGAAAQLNIYFMSMATMLTNVFVPRVHRLIASGRPDKEVSDLFIKVGRIQFMVMCFIIVGFIAIGEGFMRFYTSDSYVSQGAFTIALMLMIPTIVPSIQNLGSEIQQAKNKHVFRAITGLCVAVANVALSIPLCIWFGGVGAALGTSFTVVVGRTLMNWYYKKHIGLDIGRFWLAILRILAGMLLPLTVAIVMAVFWEITTVPQLLGAGVGIAVLGGVCMWFFGMNRDDREMIAGPILRRLKR